MVVDEIDAFYFLPLKDGGNALHLICSLNRMLGSCRKKSDATTHPTLMSRRINPNVSTTSLPCSGLGQVVPVPVVAAQSERVVVQGQHQT